MNFNPIGVKNNVYKSLLPCTLYTDHKLLCIYIFNLKQHTQYVRREYIIFKIETTYRKELTINNIHSLNIHYTLYSILCTRHPFKINKTIHYIDYILYSQSFFSFNYFV